MQVQIFMAEEASFKDFSLVSSIFPENIQVLRILTYQFHFFKEKTKASYKLQL